MRNSAIIILGCLCVVSVSRGDELQPEWLPPPLARQPFWDVTQPDQPFRFNDEFVSVSTNFLSAQSSSDPLFISGRLKLSREATLDRGTWSSNLETPNLQTLRESPALARDWTAGQSLKMPLPIEESLFMFGQFDSGADVDLTQKRWTGRTGVGWKWLPFTGSELQVRSGPVMKFEEDPQTKISERSQLSVELQAKVALMGPMFLQYAGEALPALAQADRHTVLQDLKFALPFGTNREFNFGAKYKWEDTLTPTPWTQRAELYLGLKFQR